MVDLGLNSYSTPRGNFGGVGKILLNRYILLGLPRHEWERVKIEIGKPFVFPNLDFSGVENPSVVGIKQQSGNPDISEIHILSTSLIGGEVFEIARSGKSYKLCSLAQISDMLEKTGGSNAQTN
jgi:hypothetical protein